LIFTQAFVGATRRQRILYAIFLALIAIPVIFPWFRYLFWLFQGGYFRVFSLFSIYLLLILSMTSLSRYAQGRAINIWALGGTLAVWLGLLLWPSSWMGALMNRNLARTAVAFLAGYAVLLIVGQMLKRQRVAAWVILGVTAAELIHFDRITVNRPTFTKEELKERIGYNDETVDAVHEIKANDNGFFPITKTWGAVNATPPDRVITMPWFLDTMAHPPTALSII
jgi:hypothetical protein